MNKKRAQQVFNALNKTFKYPPQKKKFSFSYKSEFLEYKSYLTNFSSEQFQLFDGLFNELAVQDSIQSLFAGAIVNKTENRPALHHRYRAPDPITDFNFKKICAPLLQKIKKEKYQNIITFGIGGSYEGPKLLQEFLFNPASDVNYTFVSGPDKDEFSAIVTPLLGQKNLYIFASKSLATDETLSCLKRLGKDRTNKNSIVITANSEGAKALGFSDLSIIQFPDSVGGRYSIWSPISITAAIENNFMGLLHGGSLADSLISGTSLEARKYQKLIKTLAFSDIWFSNFCNKKNRVVLSYNWKLRSFANYIQQLEMESLGKPSNEESIFHETGQTIFGGFGSTAQHSYFQLLHQGTSQCSADIIYSPDTQSPLSNAQAQGQASLLSSPQNQSSNFLELTNGNIPVNLFVLPKLSLRELGFLLATWEHRVFVTASLLQINPFDQFGVAAGKTVVQKFLKK
jgi:glucose-6-phosphate isomerase